MKVPNKFERSKVLHDFMYGWGRLANGPGYRVVWLRECPAVFVLTERQFRRVLIGKELSRWWRHVWRHLICRRDDRIKLNFGPFTTLGYSYSPEVMERIRNTDLRQIITEHSLKDMATDDDKRWITTIDHKTDEGKN